MVVGALSGACTAGEITMFRLWNNRADSNHRCTAAPAVKTAMLAKGYGPDAAITCAPG